MPTIEQRIANPQSEENFIRPIPISHASIPVGGGPVNALSPNGNPAPNRGIVPIGNMYDFQVNQFNPDTPYFTRGNVDSNLFTNNLALQAYVLAGGKIG
jgi:hypothetical protein